MRGFVVIVLAIAACGGEAANSAPDAGVDALAPKTDASAEAASAASGISTFSFVVNGNVQAPMACSFAHWEFAPVSGQTMCTGEPPCPGIQSAHIVNTSMLSMPYVAQSIWASQGVSSPGVSAGGANQLSGVLAPGGILDITSIYVGGITAVLGSAEPFSAADAGAPGDEGIIPWPVGVAGSGGATQMYVAEIEVYPSCQTVFHAW